MSIEYVRNTYGVPARRGGRVRTRAGLLGTITSATNYVMVRLDGGRRRAMPYHPTELDYLAPGNDASVLHPILHPRSS